MQIKNRKLPAWIGSILFHTLLLLLVLLWFSMPSPDRGASEARTADGVIVFQTGGGTRQPQAEAATTDSHSTDAELLEQTMERIAVTVLDVRPPQPVLAPGIQSGGANPAGNSATELAADFNSVPSTGIGPQSGAVTLQLFGPAGPKGTGTKFVFVFDRSGSMEGRRIQMAKAELKRSLEGLGESHQFNLIFYNHDWQVWRPGPPRRLIYATPTDKQSAVRYIDGITADGGTQHYRPLQEAINHRPDVIFFLTDGESQDDLTPVQLADIERMNNRIGRGSQINVIQFGGDGWTERRSRTLEQLATDNHGEYLYLSVIGMP